MNRVIKKTELTTAARVRRIVIGSILIGIVMGTTGPLGYLTLLPLLAVYPILTGLIGEDFLDGLLANWEGGFGGKCFRPSTRVALLVLGAGAIGAMMVSPENVGLRALLAIAALYPIMAGLFGEDLISQAFGFGRKKQPAQVVEQDVERSVKAAPRTRKPVEAGHRTATALHHRFGHHGKGPKAA
jgi:hypothetical protein